MLVHDLQANPWPHPSLHTYICCNQSATSVDALLGSRGMHPPMRYPSCSTLHNALPGPFPLRTTRIVVSVVPWVLILDNERRTALQKGNISRPAASVERAAADWSHTTQSELYVPLSLPEKYSGPRSTGKFSYYQWIALFRPPPSSLQMYTYGLYLTLESTATHHADCVAVTQHASAVVR